MSYTTQQYIIDRRSVLTGGLAFLLSSCLNPPVEQPVPKIQPPAQNTRTVNFPRQLPRIRSVEPYYTDEASHFIIHIQQQRFDFSDFQLGILISTIASAFNTNSPPSIPNPLPRTPAAHQRSQIPGTPLPESQRPERVARLPIIAGR